MPPQAVKGCVIFLLSRNCPRCSLAVPPAPGIVVPPYPLNSHVSAAPTHVKFSRGRALQEWVEAGQGFQGPGGWCMCGSAEWKLQSKMGMGSQLMTAKVSSPERLKHIFKEDSP